MPVRTAYVGTQVPGDVLTAANFTKVPGGWLGYAEVTADQTAITTIVDLTGLSVAVTAGADRRLKITGSCHAASPTAADEVDLYIREGSTTLQQRVLTVGTAGRIYALHAIAIVTPTAGAHTYKLSMARTAGAGSAFMGAGALYPAFILVEDIGPAT